VRRQRDLAGLPRQGGYGLSAAEVNAMLERQGGVCIICGRVRGQWAIDHDHEAARRHGHSDKTGCRDCVRGILCQSCNTALGGFCDSPDILRRAALYIEESRRRS